jgi:hypothetical protein
VISGKNDSCSCLRLRRKKGACIKRGLNVRWEFLNPLLGCLESQHLEEDLNLELIRSLAKRSDKMPSRIFLATKICSKPKWRKTTWINSFRRTNH